jgi:dolichol kinase
MFRAAHRSSSGTLTVFAASGLITHVVTGRSQVRLDYGRSPHAYVNQRMQRH